MEFRYLACLVAVAGSLTAELDADIGRPRVIVRDSGAARNARVI